GREGHDEIRGVCTTARRRAGLRPGIGRGGGGPALSGCGALFAGAARRGSGAVHIRAAGSPTAAAAVPESLRLLSRAFLLRGPPRGGLPTLLIPPRGRPLFSHRAWLFQRAVALC